MSHKLPAMILVGGPDERLAAAESVSAKGLIPLHGRPMLAYVLQALRAGGRSVLLVSGADLSQDLAQIPDLPRIDAPPSISAKLRAGFEALGQPARALVCAADSPFATAAGISAFCDEVVRRQLDLAYPIVTRDICEAGFPGTTRTCVRLREGEFTGGNLLVMSWPLVRDRGARIERFFAARKSPLKLALLLGPVLAAKFLLGRLSVSELESRVSRLLGGPAGAVVSDDAGIGFDIDKPEDLDLARSLQPPAIA